MPAVIWKGAINFGLINIPVKLSAATESKNIAFRSLHKKCKTPINQKRWCPSCDEEAAYQDLVKGYEYEKGVFVEITEEDFKKLPVKSKKYIQISEFVNTSEIDPIFYDKTYFLSPDAAGEKPFLLLLGAMRDTGRAAVAKITMREKEQLCIVRVYGGALALNTMFYPDEIREADSLSEDKKKAAGASKAETDMAKQIVEKLTAGFEPQKYHDEYRDMLMEIIEAKAQGDSVYRPEVKAAAGGQNLGDLLERLKASVEATKKAAAAEQSVKKSKGKAKSVKEMPPPQKKPPEAYKH